jgi:hypothetical protein
LGALFIPFFTETLRHFWNRFFGVEGRLKPNYS